MGHPDPQRGAPDQRPLCASANAQVDAILELRLYQLTGLEIDKVEGRVHASCSTRIKDLLDILAKEARVLTIIKAELKAIKEKYATPRLTDLVPDEGEIAIEDLIANEGVIITLTHNGLIKRTNVSSYRAQRRGGKGVIGMATREGATEEDAGFHRAPVHGQHARLPDVLHEHRPGLCRARARDSRHGPRRQGPQHRQPARTEAGRERSPP